MAANDLLRTQLNLNARISLFLNLALSFLRDESVSVFCLQGEVLWDDWMGKLLL